MSSQESKDLETEIIEIDGNRYVDLGGIYAMIIDEDNIDQFKKDFH